MSERLFAGLDVGGTYLKAALMDEAGVLRAHVEEPIRKEIGRASCRERV